MSEELTIEVLVCEAVFITGVWGKVVTDQLEEIEKEILQEYSPSNDPDNWFFFLAKVGYENGGHYDPSYWLVDEIGRKPAGPSVDSGLHSYLMQFDND